MTLAPSHTLIIDNAQLIGGEWVSAASGETIDVINPATTEVLARIPRGAAADVDNAVRAAEAAFPAWRDTPPPARAALLTRWAELIEQHESEIDKLESREVGRPHWGPLGLPRQLRFVAG